MFPTRSYLAQRRQVGAAQHDLDVLRKQNEKLETKCRAAVASDEIERMAREQFDLVFPGEQVYKVLAGGPAPTTTVP